MVENITSTQEKLDILDIKEGTVLLKPGGAVMVIQTTAVNFDLLSEKEQDAMIAAYATLLNALSFPLQIIIRSRRLDISSYLETVDRMARTQANPYLQERLTSYKDFVGGLVQKQEVLDKRFYLVIPYFELALPSVSPLSAINRLLGKKTQPRSIDKAGLLQRAKTDLEPKKEYIIKQLSRLGVQARQLTTQELITLFYEIYNPEQARIQHLEKGASPYTSPLVEPAIQEGIPAPSDQAEPGGEAGAPPQGTAAEGKGTASPVEPGSETKIEPEG